MSRGGPRQYVRYEYRDSALADGTVKTYWYAWKGGPRLRGDPGDPEFIVSYNEAVARKVTPLTGVLLNVLFKFEDTEEFRSLAGRTKAD